MQHLNTSMSNATALNTEILAASVVLGLCCLVGVPSNIAVVVAIVQNFEKKDFTLKIMLNLAVSDLFSLITLPLWIYNWLYGWVLDLAACKTISYLVHCSLYISLMTVTLMSVQRYLMVLYPQCWARLRGTGEKVLLVVLWAVACVLASPAIAIRDVVAHKDKRQHHCIMNYRSDGEKVAVLLMESMLGFFGTFSILVISYSCLHKRVNRTAFFNSQRLTKLVTSIVVAFFIFWFPLHFINVLDICAILLKSKTLKNFCMASWHIAVALTFFNSCVNPFLYAFSYRKLQHDSNQET